MARGRPRKNPGEPDFADGFAEGLRFFAARFAEVLVNNPIALNRVFLDVQRAGKRLQPPDLIEVYHSTVRLPWRDEFNRLVRSYGQRYPDIQTIPSERARFGRPSKDSTQWTKTENDNGSKRIPAYHDAGRE